VNTIREHYDRFSGHFSRFGAIFYLFFYVFLCCLGTLEIRGVRGPDGAWFLWMGPLTLLLGVGGVIHAVQVVCGVERRIASRPKETGGVLSLGLGQQ
jgi:hypothetical protein